MEQVYRQIEGKLELVGELDNSCDWGTLWRFRSRRTNLIYVLGHTTREKAIKRAIRLDEQIKKDSH